MEGLVNYSSEDDQDEQNYKHAAERGGSGHLRRTLPNYDIEAKRRRGGDVRTGCDSGIYGSGAGEGCNSKEQEKFVSPNTSYSTHKSYSQSNYNRGGKGDDRESKYSKEREARNGRGNRDHGNKGDDKNDRFNRSKECSSRDHTRDDSSYDNRRPHNRRDSHGNSSNKYSPSHRKNNRYSGSRHYSDSSKSHRYQGSRNDRSDYRSGRYESRKERSSTSHSPSPLSSSNSKRYSDNHRTRHRGCGSRSRSRSHSPATQRRSQSPRNPSKPIEKARNSVSELERRFNSDEYDTKPQILHQSRHERMEAVVTLPLSESAVKPPAVVAVAPISSSCSKEPAVIQLPSYYNPSVINPNKYAEQVQKRKLIWGAKKTEDISAKWGHAQFSQDSDGKVASKFMRLMGIKGGTNVPKNDPTEDDKQPANTADVKSREKMFSSMEKQYEVARQVTHTMRGVGLGFSTQARQF